jgi:hypothetical protein
MRPTAKLGLSVITLSTILVIIAKVLTRTGYDAGSAFSDFVLSFEIVVAFPLSFGFLLLFHAFWEKHYFLGIILWAVFFAFIELIILEIGPI